MAWINGGLKWALYADARAHDEWATTRLWEHLLKEVFSSENWVLASQQPVTLQEPLRRVDLVIEQLDLNTGQGPKVLMVEAKKHSASRTEMEEVEFQAYQAAMSYSQDISYNPVWYLACVGTTARIWIFDPNHPIPVPFLPGKFGLENMSEQFLDLDRDGVHIRKALKYIRNHPHPPDKYVPRVTLGKPGQETSVDSPQSPDSTQDVDNEAILTSAFVAGETFGLDSRLDPNPNQQQSSRGFGQGTDAMSGFWQSGQAMDTATGSMGQQQSFHDLGAVNDADLGDQGAGQVMDTAVGTPAQQNDGSRDPTWRQVKVTVEPHYTSKDVWIFKDHHGKRIAKERVEWKKMKKDHVWVFTLKRGNSIFYTGQEL